MSRRAQTLLLGTIFLLSGFAGLVYQVAWQRLLTVHYGVGAVSVTLIVSVYMFGLGLGGLLGGRLADRSPGRVGPYLAVEVGLGVFGLLSLPFLSLLGRATAGASFVLTAVLAFAFLAIPTVLMGMTLPLVVKIFDGWLSEFGATVSLLYFLNTLGAAFGALIAAYGLISFFGLDVAVYVAVATNFTLALAILLLRRGQAPPPAVAPESQAGAATRRGALALVFTTGFLAIGYELVWFRVVGVLVKDSPYAFATVLSVYLVGVALGSLAIRERLRRAVDDAPSLFFFLQFLLGFAALASVAILFHGAQSGPLSLLTRLSFSQKFHPPIAAFLHDPHGVGLFALIDIFFWPGALVFLPTVFMGASFPLIASIAYQPGSEGRTVGSLYFSNLLGNLLGGALTGLVLLPWLGTERTLLGLGSVGLLALLGVQRRFGRALPRGPRLVAVGVCIAAAALVFPAKGELYRALHPKSFPATDEHLEEGRDGVVFTRATMPRLENYINGQAHGGRPVYPFMYEAVEALAHAPALDSVMIIGFGSGSIAEVVLASQAKHVVLVELNGGLLTNLRKMEHFRAVLSDPRLDIVVDDARRQLLRDPARYDLILMDPLRTTTAYSNNLYSKEFFELARSRLTDQGVLMLWTDEFRVLPRTVATVFPQVKLSSFFVLASSAEIHSDAERRAQVLAALPADDRDGVNQVVSEWVADGPKILEQTRGAPINEDARPVCEYYLGLEVGR